MSPIMKDLVGNSWYQRLFTGSKEACVIFDDLLLSDKGACVRIEDMDEGGYASDKTA